MNKEEIRRLEPKYMGNTRHLTPGEAGEILNDPNNAESQNDPDVANPIPLAAPFTNNMMSSGVMSGGIVAPGVVEVMPNQREKNEED